ncbi:MAG: putative DNA-binding protein [Eubacteriaceae bacterium]
MEKKVKEQYLFDFYGELLTEKQKQILEYYYNDDYSLAEIAEVMSVTRQGIFDVIKRSKSMMEAYEEKLGLIEKFLNTQNLFSSIKKDLSELQSVLDSPVLQRQVESIIEKLDAVSEEN